MPRYSLRPMGKKDLMMVFRWRNHKVNREASLDSRKLSLKEHKEWFINIVPEIRYIYQVNDRSSGIVIFNPISLYWSIYLSPFRIKRKGLGSCMACLAIHAIKSKGYDRIKAIYGSDASRQFHEKLGFVNGVKELV